MGSGAGAREAVVLFGVNDAVLDVLDGASDVLDGASDVLDGVSDDVFDVFAAIDDPAAPADDVAVEPEPLPDALDALRLLLPLEPCAVPTAAARRESLALLAPRSLRKSRRAF